MATHCEANNPSPRPGASRGRRWLGRLFLLLVIALSVVGGGAAWLYQAARQVPDFYHQALQPDVAAQRAAGDELERHVLELHNEVQCEGQWEAVFTEEEINGWLAVDMPEKFPQVLPTTARDPRVAIDPAGIQVACRVDSPKLKAVISFAVDVQLTDETNTLAVRVHQVRAGAIPIPLKPFLDHISRAAERGQIRLRWGHADGDPVALVTIPSQHPDYAVGEVIVETFQLQPGEVKLAGRTERTSAPRTAFHVPAARARNSAIQ